MKVHCWLMVSFLSTWPLRSFSAKLLSSQSPPSLCWCLSCCSSGQDLFQKGMYFSGTSWGSSLTISPACQGPSAQWHNQWVYQPPLPAVHHPQTCWGYTVPPSRSLMKRLNSTGSSTHPWGHHYWLAFSWTLGHRSRSEPWASFQSILLPSYLTHAVSVRKLWKNSIKKPCSGKHL